MYALAKPRAKRAKNFFEGIFSVCGGGRKPFVGGVKGTCGGGIELFVREMLRFFKIYRGFYS